MYYSMYYKDWCSGQPIVCSYGWRLSADAFEDQMFCPGLEWLVHCRRPKRLWALGLKAFSETDLAEDLKKFDVATLIMQGDDDQIVPIADLAIRSARIIKNAIL